MDSQLQYTDLTRGYSLAILVTFLAIIATFTTVQVWVTAYHIHHLLYMEIGGGVFLLVVLGLEIQLIFQPMVRSVIEKMKMLERANALHIQTQEILEEGRQTAEQSARWRAQFLATMSHEIRTPMNGVMGMTQLLLSTRLTTEQREFVNTIRLSGETLLAVINDILDFSKIEAGRMTLEEQPFIIGDCIEETFDLFVAKALSNNIDLFYWIDDEVPSCILGDVTRVKQVLTNLISNALKFTTNGEIFVSISYLICDHNKDFQTIQVAVTDTGIGIEENQLETIFESFQQADNSIARQYGGSGLGLSICKHLCELMGGKIWVKSKIAKGSAFYFTLPAKTAHLPEVFSPIKLEDKQILVVDDNATNRRVLSLQLQRWGSKVQTCASGEEALVWLESHHFCDVAILDMVMPDMNGLQLALQIRQLPHRQSLPLVMLSSIDKVDIDLEISQSLFAAYICKPIKRLQLFDTLANVLSGKHRTQYETTSPFCNSKNLAKQFPLRILLAEDDPVSRQLEVLLLQSMGYTVDVVNNGMEVLEALNQQSYHLIFMDVQMPLMNGFVTTSAILDQYPPASCPKIIAVTANALEEDRKRCLAVGMDDYLRKPVQYQEMWAILEKWGKICFSTKRELHSSENRAVMPRTPSLLDLERVEEIKTLAGTKFLPKIVQPFLSQSTELVDNITLLTQRGDAEALGKVVHQLKGSSASLGATYLANLCKQIELKSRQKDWDDIETLCTELKASYAQTHDQLIRIGQLYG